MKSRFHALFFSAALTCLIAACGSDNTSPAGFNPGTIPGHGTSRLGQHTHGRRLKTGRLVFSKALLDLIGRDVIPAANCVRLTVPPKAPAYITVSDSTCKTTFVQWGAKGAALSGTRPTTPLRHWEIFSGTRAIGRFDAKVFRRPDGTSYPAYEIADLCTGTYGCQLNVVDGSIRGLR